jgi:BMFP domain-containing protein YqiC
MTTSKPQIRVIKGKGASAPLDVSTAFSKIAVSIPTEKVIERKRFKSRFFFQIDTTIEERKEQFKPKKLEHVDADIIERADRYKKEVSATLQSKIDQISDFFLSEIAPLSIASSGGSRKAYKVVERYLDDKVDTTLQSTFDTMIVRAARLKMAMFVAELFKLPKDQVDELMPKVAVDPEKKVTQQIKEMMEPVLKALESQDRKLNRLTGIQK